MPQRMLFKEQRLNTGYEFALELQYFNSKD